MQLTTATKESKPKKAKKKPGDPPAAAAPDIETAGKPQSSDSPEPTETLLDRLAKLGFIVGDDDLTDVELLDASEWLEAKEFPEVAVPEFLRHFEAVDALLTQSALDAGKAKGLAGASENTCPYPPDTILRAYWTDGFKSGAAQKEANRKADFEARQKLAIEDAQSRMESAVENQREYRRVWNQLKSRLKSVKQDYEDSVEEAQEAYEQLQAARDGNLPLQRPLPFKDEDRPGDQNIGGPPPELPEDFGGKKDLNCLKKGTIQKATGCREDIGLTDKQIDSLKEQVGGDTIAHLEKFQRENQYWNRDLKGFGEERITQLQDAHSAIRTKWPEPTVEDATAAVMNKAAEHVNSGLISGVTAVGPNGQGMTHTQAVRRLQDLVARAGDVADECDNPDGVKFCESVAEEAGKVCGTILESGQVTAKQIEALCNWETGVEGWATDEDDEDIGDDE